MVGDRDHATRLNGQPTGSDRRRRPAAGPQRRRLDLVPRGQSGTGACLLYPVFPAGLQRAERPDHRIRDAHHDRRQPGHRLRQRHPGRGEQRLDQGGATGRGRCADTGRERRSRSPPSTSTGAGGLIARLRINFTSGDPLVIDTGASAKAANTESTGWQAQGFDDSTWPDALDLGTYGISPWKTGVTVAPPATVAAPLLRKEFTATGAHHARPRLHHRTGQLHPGHQRAEGRRPTPGSRLHGIREDRSLRHLRRNSRPPFRAECDRCRAGAGLLLLQHAQTAHAAGDRLRRRHQHHDRDR